MSPRPASVPSATSPRPASPPALALALLLALAPAGALAAPPADAAVKAEAQRTVAAASAAFTAGDHAGALALFEAAMRLRPSTKLHYNIGVCQQRLTREAAARGDTDAESRHASAAIEAFNAYLRGNPDAKDRALVEDLVRELGGTPATQARLRDPLAPSRPPLDPNARPASTTPLPADPNATPASTPPLPADPNTAPASTTPSDPNTAPASTPPLPARPLPTDPTAPRPAPRAPTEPDPLALPAPRGYLGLDLGLVTQPQLLAHADLDGAYQGLVALRGGARLGPRRRLELGGQLWLALPGETRETRLALSAQTALLDLGVAIPLGKRRRLELPVGGFAGVAREALHVRAGQELPACATRTTGTLVSARAGGVVGGRVGVAVLVGARRNHELGMHITLAFFGFGPGGAAATPAQCDERPFTAQDVPRARLVITSALGYAFRF